MQSAKLRNKLEWLKVQSSELKTAASKLKSFKFKF